MTRFTVARTLRLTVVLFAVLLSLSACAQGPAMRVPQDATRNTAWSVLGYSEGSFLERDFTLDGRAVQNITRSTPATAHPNQTTALNSQRRYRFDMVSAERTLRAECKEVTDPMKLWIVRFGRGKVHLDCTCREGELPRAELSLVEGTGSLRLREGAHFEVTPVHDSADGKQLSAALGYQIRGTAGSGALERTGSGRAWPPPGLDARATSELACVYAALFLYRPEP